MGLISELLQVVDDLFGSIISLGIFVIIDWAFTIIVAPILNSTGVLNSTWGQNILANANVMSKLLVFKNKNIF